VEEAYLGGSLKSIRNKRVLSFGGRKFGGLFLEGESIFLGGGNIIFCSVGERPQPQERKYFRIQSIF